MASIKRCKGTSKETKGFGCGVELPYTEMNGIRSYKAKYGLGLSCGCYSNWLLSTPEGKEKMQQAALKATKSRREFEEFEREEKERKSLPRELQLTQVVFNTYIRERDKYKPRISSLEPWKPNHDAGHLFTVKQYSALRFDEDNCHGQTVGDNRFKEGNFEDYLINIKHRIGS